MLSEGQCRLAVVTTSPASTPSSTTPTEWSAPRRAPSSVSLTWMEVTPSRCLTCPERGRPPSSTTSRRERKVSRRPRHSLGPPAPAWSCPWTAPARLTSPTSWWRWWSRRRCWPQGGEEEVEEVEELDSCWLLSCWCCSCQPSSHPCRACWRAGPSVWTPSQRSSLTGSWTVSTRENLVNI